MASRAYGALAAVQAESLRPHGLSASGFNVLRALRNTPGQALEPRQLAGRLLVSGPSVTGLLDTLEGHGLITRRPHPDDRRRVLVELTAAGDLTDHGADEEPAVRGGPGSPARRAPRQDDAGRCRALHDGG